MSSSNPTYLDFVVLQNLEHIVVTHIWILEKKHQQKARTKRSVSLLARMASRCRGCMRGPPQSPQILCGTMRAAASSRVRACGACGRGAGSRDPPRLHPYIPSPYFLIKFKFAFTHACINQIVRAWVRIRTTKY